MLKKREHGVALLAAMLLLVVLSAYTLVGKLNEATLNPYHQERGMRALSEAKSALIGYAMTYAENHSGQPEGYLPCPDTDGDGSADPCTFSAGSSLIGRLPWRTLDLEPLRDGAGECLWYAVSGNFRAAATKTQLSSESNGLFEIQDDGGSLVVGSTANNRAVAVVFAPGLALANQDRSAATGPRTQCGSATSSDAVEDAANYLESAGGVNNATGAGNGGTAMPTASTSRFVGSSPVRDGTGNIVLNDLMVAITPSDLTYVYSRMDRWVAERVRQCLFQYASTVGAGDGRYPWASALNASAAPDYTDDSSERFGRIPDLPLSSSQSSALGAGFAMSPNWAADPNLSSQTCFDGSAAQIAWSWWWWPGWKEQVFYGVDDKFSPVGDTSGIPAALRVDGAPAEALVLVAGRPLTGQSRSSNALKADVSQYAENDGTYDNRPDNGPGTVYGCGMTLPAARSRPAVSRSETPKFLQALTIRSAGIRVVSRIPRMNSEIRKGIVGVPRIASSMSGFTLVEIAVVLVILALLLATVLGPLATRLEAEERQRAQDELSEIKEAILGFAVSNGRMPCPDIDGDGAEDRTAGACTDPIGNTYVIAGLPWQTLGVDREDPWTNNYLYGVTKSFADNPPSGTTGTCTTAAALSSFNLCDPGNIIINDENGT